MMQWLCSKVPNFCAAFLVAGTALLALAIGQSADAESLLKTELEDIEGYELLVWTNDFPAGSATDLHHHAGHEVLYVLEGEVSVRAGDLTQTYGAGQIIHVPAGASMQVRNVSDSPARTLVYMLAKKGQPLKSKE